MHVEDMMVFCVNLTRPRGVQLADKMLFLGAFVRMFSGKISVWVSRLGKDHFHQWGWASSNPLNRNVEEGQMCSLLEPGQAPRILVLRPLDSDFIIPDFPGPPACRLWDLWVSIITLTNSISQSVNQSYWICISNADFGTENGSA